MTVDETCWVLIVVGHHHSILDLELTEELKIGFRRHKDNNSDLSFYRH